LDNAIIGFDRYGRTVAALVPVEAIYMLAGLARLVDSNTRKDIERSANAFARNVPYRNLSPEQIAAAASPKSKSKASRPASAAKKTAAPRRRR
jgi:hypothetical protein